MNFSTYPDTDLLESYSTALDYSGKPDKDLMSEIDRRGGIEALKKRVDEENIVPAEIRRIQSLVFSLYWKKVENSEIRAQITSEILSTGELDDVVRKAIMKAEIRYKDLSITRRTILGALIGTIISSVAGGVLWYYINLQTGKIYYVITPFILLVSYPIIWFCTRLSKNNAVVFIANFLSAFIAIILGIWLYRNAPF